MDNNIKARSFFIWMLYVNRSGNIIPYLEIWFTSRTECGISLLQVIPPFRLTRRMEPTGKEFSQMEEIGRRYVKISEIIRVIITASGGRNLWPSVLFGRGGAVFGHPQCMAFDRPQWQWKLLSTGDFCTYTG